MPLVIVALAPLLTVAAVVAAMSPIAYSVAVAVAGAALWLASGTGNPTSYLVDRDDVIARAKPVSGVATIRTDRVVRVAGLCPIRFLPAVDDVAVDVDVAATQAEIDRLLACLERARISRHRARAASYQARIAELDHTLPVSVRGTIARA